MSLNQRAQRGPAAKPWWVGATSSRVFGSVTAAVLLLVACRPDAAPPRSTLVVAQATDPGALNPAITTSGNTHPVTDQIFNGLVGLDEALKPVPELAERWTIGEDGRTYTFSLRRDVLFHDGTPFTSADVKFTFEHALLVYHSRTRAGLEPVLQNIETPDPHTVVFRFDPPYGPLLQRLDVVEASILPRHVFEGEDVLSSPANLHPIGTGPFRFVRYDRGERILLERNPHYFRPGRPHVEHLVFRILPSAATALVALEHGEIDYLPGVPGSELARLRARPEIVLAQSAGGSGGSNCQEVLIPNLTRPPFDQLSARQAFYHSLDLELIQERVYFGQGRPATGPISSELRWAYNADVRTYPRDTERAGRLLDGAGYPRRDNGPRFMVTFTHGTPYARVGQILREQLQTVGIDLRLEAMDFNAAVEKVFIQKNFDLGIASYCNGADPDIGVRRLYVSSNIGPIPFSNGAGYRNPRIDALFDEAVQTTDRDARARVYAEIQRILTEDLPYFWILDSAGYRAYRDTWTGFRFWTGAFAETVRPVREGHDPMSP